MVTLINKEKNIIFLHIPKTGGTSINDAMLEKQASIDSSNPGNAKSTFFNNTVSSSHSNIKQLGLSKEKSDIYEIFTVIRNPYTRIASTYNHFIQGPNNQSQRVPWTTETYTFKQYLRNIKDYFEGKLVVSLPDENGNGNCLYRAFSQENLYRAQNFGEDLKFLLDIRHVEKLSWWLQTTDGLSANCTYLKFEQLEKDWQSFREKININRPIQHLNKNVLTGAGANSPEDYMSYYDEECKEIIQQLYKYELRNYE